MSCHPPKEPSSSGVSDLGHALFENTRRRCHRRAHVGPRPLRNEHQYSDLSPSNESTF